jgi:hypothetical protein
LKFVAANDIVGTRAVISRTAGQHYIATLVKIHTKTGNDATFKARNARRGRAFRFYTSSAVKSKLQVFAISPSKLRCAGSRGGITSERVASTRTGVATNVSNAVVGFLGASSTGDFRENFVVECALGTVANLISPGRVSCGPGGRTIYPQITTEGIEVERITEHCKRPTRATRQHKTHHTNKKNEARSEVKKGLRTDS